MLKIFFSTAVEPCEKVSPKERQQQIDQISNAQARAESFSAWKLLEYALQQIYSVRIDEIEFRRDDFGKWECDLCFFSVSHSHGALCVAVSDMPVGIDIESMFWFERRFKGSRLLSLWKKLNVGVGTLFCKSIDCAEDTQEKSIASKNEAAEALPLPVRTLALWTAKEAALKLHGGTDGKSVFAQRVGFLNIFKFPNAPAANLISCHVGDDCGAITVFCKFFESEWCVSYSGVRASEAEFCFVAL